MSQSPGDIADSRAARRIMASSQQSPAFQKSPASLSERRGWQQVKYPHCEGLVQEFQPWRDAHLTLCDLEVSRAYHGQHPFQEGVYLCLVLEGRLLLSDIDGAGIDLSAGQGGIFRPARTQSGACMLQSEHPRGRLRCLSLSLDAEAGQSLQVQRSLANWDALLPCAQHARPLRWAPGRWLHQQLDERVRAPQDDGLRGEWALPAITAREEEVLEWQGIALQLLGAALRQRSSETYDDVVSTTVFTKASTTGSSTASSAVSSATSSAPCAARSTDICRHLEAVRQRLLAAPHGTHSLEELARLACMSASSLRQKFRETYGCSLSQYQRECRMQRARQALLQGMSVQQVAHRVGYAHACNFATAYRRHFGLSPQAVRARPQRAD